jgi:hypothetical protein
MGAGLEFSCSLGCSPVFGDQAAENLPVLDPGGDVGGSGGRPVEVLAAGSDAVGGRKVVAGELAEHLAEVVLAEDQDVVQALAAERLSGRSV